MTSSSPRVTPVRAGPADVERERLIEAVRTVAGGESLFAPSVIGRLVAHYVERPPASAAGRLRRRPGSATASARS